MRTQLNTRLVALKTEYESGEKMLAELEHKQARLRETLLRISGAIQVLEEVLGDGEVQPADTTANGVG
ncbi:MAG: hypothetical protein SH847_15065 [Roseiflexaceae bacterium]|nr:hypothetical protein [Roseiflexaceae bacterium]